MNFSVLISVYRKEKPEYLRASLDSIFNQTLQPDEVVLVEDGPLRKELYEVSEEFANSYPNFKRVPLPENQGLGKALNEGLKHCPFDLIARMDSDDIAMSDRFEKQVKFMEDYPDIDACSSWIEEFIGSPDNVVSVCKVPETPEECVNFIKRRNPMNHPAVMFRKSAVERAGGYRHFPLFEDWYLWARMVANGSKIANIQEPLLFFRTSPDMFRRRGGWKYAVTSAKFQHELHRLGIISAMTAVQSSLLRGVVYVMPNYVRKLIYTKILR